MPSAGAATTPHKPSTTSAIPNSTTPRDASSRARPASRTPPSTTGSEDNSTATTSTPRTPNWLPSCKAHAGERFLRRLVLAAHACFHQAGTCGIRDLCRFFIQAGLDAFVAPSYGAQHALAKTLREQALAYGQSQQQRLAAGMAAKSIVACLDENFHGDQACLVAIEPASNFLLLETYQQRRDAQTWTAALKQSLHGLDVTIVAVTSDQAKGLIACAHDGLDAQHSPDLFHGQQELTRATALALHRQTEAARVKLQQAEEYVAAEQRRQQEYEQQPRRPGRAPDWRIAQRMAEMFRRQAAERLAACQERQQRARQAVRGLGDDYHPFDAHSGQPLEAAEVQERLEQRVAAVEQVVAEASLAERGREAVGKSRRWLVLLAATLSWYWAEVRRRIEALELSSSAERAVYQQLLPGLYWQAAAERGRDAEQRQRLRQLSQRLLRRARSPRGPLGRLAEEEREAVAKVVREAAGLFVRSSSCVEGRNGRLSLYHHGQGPLHKERLQALTVWHNYGCRAFGWDDSSGAVLRVEAAAAVGMVVGADTGLATTRSEGKTALEAAGIS